MQKDDDPDCQAIRFANSLALVLLNGLFLIRQHPGVSIIPRPERFVRCEMGRRTQWRLGLMATCSADVGRSRGKWSYAPVYIATRSGNVEPASQTPQEGGRAALSNRVQRRPQCRYFVCVDYLIADSTFGCVPPKGWSASKAAPSPQLCVVLAAQCRLLEVVRSMARASSLDGRRTGTGQSRGGPPGRVQKPLAPLAGLHISYSRPFALQCE
jgi:hypothetical protein